jgi:hypothetical protein
MQIEVKSLRSLTQSHEKASLPDLTLLTGNTVTAIAKAVEGMDIDFYHQAMDLQPVHNRLTKVLKVILIILRFF